LNQLSSLERKNLGQVIVKIIHEKGNGILSEGNILVALINDLFPNHQKVIFLLECVLKKTSFQFLWEAFKRDKSSYDINLTIIKKELHSTYSLDINAIDWIFGALKDAFDLIEKEEKSNLDKKKNELIHEKQDEESLLIQNLKEEISKKEEIISEQKRIIETYTQLDQIQNIKNQERQKKPSLPASSNKIDNQKQEQKTNLGPLSQKSTLYRQSIDLFIAIIIVGIMFLIVYLVYFYQVRFHQDTPSTINCTKITLEMKV